MASVIKAVRGIKTRAARYGRFNYFLIKAACDGIFSWKSY